MNESFLIGERFPDVAFGTSGVRALVADLSAEAVRAYLFAFMQQMGSAHAVGKGATVVVGMDLRPSSPAISAAACSALKKLGFNAEFLGIVPTPVLALHCLQERRAGVMVTGSHIPFDRNGIKFYSPAGEILKADEQAILSSPIPTSALKNQPDSPPLPEENHAPAAIYIRRYLDYFGAQRLHGLRIGLYEHSAAGRDLTRSILEQLGAEVIALGRSDEFVPIDTEAVGQADLIQARAWCQTHSLDALVSTDGDGDRPLVFDARGEFVRGDLLGLMCARSLGLRRLAVPVSCNTAIERCGFFHEVVRTRIGSPFVIAAMDNLSSQRTEPVAGFEANGGFLLGSGVSGLTALPTRDALLPMLSLLSQSAKEQRSIQALVAELPQRHVYSDRLEAYPAELSRALLARLLSDPDGQARLIGKPAPPIDINTTDGLRLSFTDGDIVHLRASGNAPELRCYAEADSLEQAKALCAAVLAGARSAP